MTSEVTLSMPTSPQIDPTEVIHYFTNGENSDHQPSGVCDNENKINDQEANFVPCTQEDGQ